MIGCSGRSDRNVVSHGKIEREWLKGLWYYASFKSANYNEVYIDDCVYFHVNESDNFVNHYDLTALDSFRIVRNGDVVSLKLAAIDRNTFKAIIKNDTTTYHRIIDTVFLASDWKKIIKGDRGQIFEKCKLYYDTREYDFRVGSK